MRVYPAIVPPPEISSQVTNFSNSLATLYPNVTAQRASGPHITLKAPQYPDALETWLQVATSAAEGVEPFEITFDEPTFLTRGVLVLRASAPQLPDLNRRLATALAGYNHPGITNFDYDLYTPHITLAYTTGASRVSARPSTNNRSTTYSRYRLFGLARYLSSSAMIRTFVTGKDPGFNWSSGSSETQAENQNPPPSAPP